MIKQRMPYFLGSLEELRCDLTAFREATKLIRAEDTDEVTREHAKLVQYTVIFDRIFRFPITGSRVRNYDGLGGQCCSRGCTSTTCALDRHPAHHRLGRGSGCGGRAPTRSTTSIGAASTARRSPTGSPPTTLCPARSRRTRHLAGRFATLLLDGPPMGLTDEVLDDEFPLSMFYEALATKMGEVVESTAGITGVADWIP